MFYFLVTLLQYQIKEESHHIFKIIGEWTGFYIGEGYEQYYWSGLQELTGNNPERFFSGLGWKMIWGLKGHELKF